MIRKGEKIVMWYISANRDERVFPDAERFDVGRENARRHLGFGHGIHRCVGAKLAEVAKAAGLKKDGPRFVRKVRGGIVEASEPQPGTVQLACIRGGGHE